jgi:hypothetical protein
MKKNVMYRLIILLFLFQFNTVHSQRIFSSTGVLVSFLDMKTTDLNGTESSAYPKGIVRSSIGLAFETKEWKRFSFTTAASYFISGGQRNDQTSYSPTKVQFDNFCLGVSGNYYIMNSKTQLYIGFGPRLDYIRSQEEVYRELIGDSYYAKAVRTLKVGVTGSIGVNFQLKQVNLGLKSNYYYRPALFDKEFNTKPGVWGLTNDFKHMTIRDYVFDLQVVIGYRFGKE